MNTTLSLCAAAICLLTGTAALAQQVIVPEVERREVKLPKFPSKDIAVGLFAGTYATQNFGAAAVVGGRLGYHITEDWFVEATLGQSKVSDEAFRQVLPGGIFTDPKERLSYYEFSAGYNLLPGEVFPTAKRAKATAIYLVAGVGSTKFNQQRSQTIAFGLGGRLLLTERAALQFDMRDHVFSLDLLGKRQSTHNLELTGGFTYYF
ncbi:MAG: outer membrane beta-barrel domain-containing protein [Burkholderiaceae bacterium]